MYVNFYLQSLAHCTSLTFFPWWDFACCSFYDCMYLLISLMYFCMFVSLASVCWLVLVFTQVTYTKIINCADPFIISCIKQNLLYFMVASILTFGGRSLSGQMEMLDNLSMCFAKYVKYPLWKQNRNDILWEKFICTKSFQVYIIWSISISRLSLLTVAHHQKK